MNTPIYHLEHVVRAKSDELLEDFDGPLDLILHLLSKNKMEIADIQISMILDQYLDWMNKRKELDLEIASEFVSMASQLIFIKTRMLLSIHDEEAISEMEQLIASLEERRCHDNYMKVKSVIEPLNRRYLLGRDYLTKMPEPLQKDKNYRYVHQPEDLTRAMRDIFARSEGKSISPLNAFDGIVGREPYPVTSKAKELLGRLVKFGVTRFRSLFRGSRSRSEIVATFLAVLELCKTRKINLAGTESDCTVTCTDGEQTTIETTTEF